MSQIITINSINHDGELANVLFTPDNDPVVINLGDITLPFVFEPSYTTKYGNPLIHRIINDRKWDVEDKKKWVTEDSNAFHYDIETKKENE
jgi:hypothetical protein